MAIDPRAASAAPYFRLRQDRPVDLGRALAARGVEIVSTGGTAAALAKAGVAVVDVAELTGFPGDDGRAAEDAASARPRRPARRPRRARASGVDDRPRHRADRPAGRQPLSLRGRAQRAPRRSTTCSRTSTSAARR